MKAGAKTPAFLFYVTKLLLNIFNSYYRNPNSKYKIKHLSTFLFRY